ncbi:MAG TPA: aminotransferase class V-fold PLP-dependent enzyme [Longimicrobium sp.]|uniref:aminotransferase class V-fold PLP-dependent enzyme n=1 Tax=Longimicrobium sp. TaxID=2029185 RepID=UPI002EDA1188
MPPTLSPATRPLPQVRLADNPLHLFAPPLDDGGEERVDELVRAFLDAADAGDGIPAETLTPRFGASEVPQGTVDLDTYLAYLDREVVSHASRVASPRYIGHMTSALPYFVQPLARLVAALNQNVVKLETAASLTPYERQALGIMHRLAYGYGDAFYDAHVQAPESTLGILTSGGTVANLTAMWCARNTALRADGGFAGVEQEGLAAALAHYGHRRAVIVGSSLMHFSFDKAADLMGLGVRGVVKVPVDARLRANPEAVRAAVERCRAEGDLVLAVVGVAGTTEAGSVDPLDELADVAAGAGAHYHVDAAWGGATLFSRRHRTVLAGIERADSVTIDGHKQMYTPLGTGLILFRDPDLARSVEKTASYVLRRGSGDLGRRSLEGSRPAAAVHLHAGLHLLGRRGYEYLVDEGVRKAAYMAGRLRQRPEFQLVAEPQLNILLYRYLPEPLRERAHAGTLTPAELHALNEFNARLQKQQWDLGRTFVSRTTLDKGDAEPMVALRVVLANPLTQESDIDCVLADQVAIARELEL